jgi:hypothetical protein
VPSSSFSSSTGSSGSAAVGARRRNASPPGAAHTADRPAAQTSLAKPLPTARAEPIRRELLRVKHAFDRMDPVAHPWKAFGFRTWLTDYFIPAIHCHHDNEGGCGRKAR